MTAQREIRSLTGLRGVAAVYVVLFHYFDGLTSTNPFAIFLGHGYLAVDLFFVLSGFVLALTYRHLFLQTNRFWPSYMKFLGRRLARIYPLYLAGTAIGYILFISSQKSGTSHADGLKLLASNLTMVQAWIMAPSLDGPGWSISTEWAAYLLFPSLLAVVYFKNKPRNWSCLTLSVVALGAAWLLATLFGNHTSESDRFTVGILPPLLRCLPEFTLGILVLRCYTGTLETYLHARPWLAPLVTVALFASLMVRYSDYAVVLLFPLLILCLLPGNSLPARFLGWGPVHYLGVLSYSLYIVHNLFTGVMAHVHQWAQNHGMAHAQTYAAAVGIALSLPISALSYRYIELPGRNFLRRLFEGPAAPAPVAP